MDLAIFSQSGVLFLLRWFHIFFGVIWIGILYYFNFIQGEFFKETDGPTKSNAVSKLVPRALWWFRYGALFTWLTGVFILAMRGHQDIGFFTTSRGLLISVGALMGTFMFLNVWLIIWPAQQIVIASTNAVLSGGQADPKAAKAGAAAGLASRTNTLFSIPLLFFMASAVHLPLRVDPDISKLPWLAAMLVIICGIELNAIIGKTGPMTSVKGVIHMGFVLTAVLYAACEFLL